jgi:adenylate kinase
MFKNILKALVAGLMITGLFASLPLMAQDKKEPLVLILLGPPGAGKGTHATTLCEQLTLPHISTGDLLRENVRQGSELGKKAQLFIEKGQLVPDTLIMELLFKRVAQSDCAQGYILDGFPRTLPQAKALQKHFKSLKPIVINLDLKEEEILERLSGRVSCEQCGTPYHMVHSPSKTPGMCDKCQGILVHRKDDTREVILKRLQVYNEQTAPLLTYYTSLKLLHNIKSGPSKEKVFQDIVSHVNRSSKE